MEQRDLICICCPLGCRLEVQIDNSQVLSVKGHSCKRGIEYGIKECSNPTRVLTSTVLVENGCPEVASVKSEKDIPKNMLLDCMKELKKIKLAAPVYVGDVILRDILGTGVNIVATTNCDVQRK